VRGLFFQSFKAGNADSLYLLRLQACADLQVQSDIFIPGILPGIAEGVLPIHTADVRALCINGAAFAKSIIMSASAITTIEKPGFGGHMNESTAQAALGAGKGRRGSSGVVHGRGYRLKLCQLRLEHLGKTRAGARDLFLCLCGFLSVCQASDFLNALFRCQNQVAILVQNRGVDHGLEQLSKLDRAENHFLAVVRE
jgi:hypothetical protein